MFTLHNVINFSRHLRAFQASNLTPSAWPDPTLGPFAMAKAFVRTGFVPHASIANLHPTGIFNVLLQYPGVSQHLSPATRTNLEALKRVHNEGIAHWRKPELSSDRMQAYLGVCRAALEAGPWAEGDFKEGAQLALDNMRHALRSSHTTQQATTAGVSSLYKHCVALWCGLLYV